MLKNEDELYLNTNIVSCSLLLVVHHIDSIDLIKKEEVYQNYWSQWNVCEHGEMLANLV